jgi:hypothetical protein
LLDADRADSDDGAPNARSGAGPRPDTKHRTLGARLSDIRGEKAGPALSGNAGSSATALAEGRLGSCCLTSLREIGYDLNEALTLLGTLEDARDALIDSGHLAVVVAIETEIRTLSRKLGFDDPAGGSDGR